MVYVPGADDIRIKACCDGLKKSKDVFKDYLTEIKEEKLVKDEELEVVAHTDSSYQNNKVFVVHGHDEALKEKVVIRSQARKTVFTGGVWEVGDSCRGHAGAVLVKEDIQAGG